MVAWILPIREDSPNASKPAWDFSLLVACDTPENSTHLPGYQPRFDPIAEIRDATLNSDSYSYYYYHYHYYYYYYYFYYYYYY